MALVPTTQATDVAKKDRAVNISSTTSPSAVAYYSLLYIVPEGKMFSGYAYGTGTLYINGGVPFKPFDGKFYLNAGDTITVETAVAHSMSISGVESEYSFR